MMGRDLHTSMDKVGRHNCVAPGTRERGESPFFQRLGTQAFHLLVLRFHSMAFATQCMTVGLVIVPPPAMKWYDVVDLKGCGEECVAVGTRPPLTCCNNSFFMSGDSTSWRHVPVSYMAAFSRLMKKKMMPESLNTQHIDATIPPAPVCSHGCRIQ